ncbi:hypothetical protein D3C85_1889840 [compost metagenome]
MLPTVQFDHQALLDTDEIDYVPPHGLLTLELKPEESVAPQVVPEAMLGLGHVAAQALCEILQIH